MSNDKKKIKELEERLARYEGANAKARLYRGLIKQVNDISELFEKINISEEDLRDKNDKFFERYFKYLNDMENITKGIDALEKSVVPPKQEERKSASVYEEAIKKNNNGSSKS